MKLKKLWEIMKKLENGDLKKLTYYQMGSTASHVLMPETISEVQDAILFARSKNLPIFVLGEGSNTVGSDEPLEAVIIILQYLKFHQFEGPQSVYIEAGLTNTEVALLAAAKGYSDFAWMYKMPGCFGASVRMNARCYGGETSEIVEDVLSIDQNGRFHTRKAHEVFLGYKKTYFMTSPEIVVACRLKLKKRSSEEAVWKIMADCLVDREKKGHFLYPSCGSTFKNNYIVGKPSGQVFDELGLKGLRSGNMGVSPKHANFIFNYGEGNTKDFLSLVNTMHEQALTKNADLELEVQPYGLFSKKDLQALKMDGSQIVHEDRVLVGSFWHPEVETKVSMPFTIYKSFGVEWLPSSDPFDVTFKLDQLKSFKEALKNPKDPFLRVSFEASEQYFKHNPTQPVTDESLDGLWIFDVFECFFAHPQENKESYLEFEVSPKTGAYLNLRFSGRRRRKELFHQKAKNIKIIKENHRFHVSVSFSFLELKPYLLNKKILFLGTMHSKNHFIISHRIKKLPKNPDFHNTYLYWLLDLV